MIKINEKTHITITIGLLITLILATGTFVAQWQQMSGAVDDNSRGLRELSRDINSLEQAIDDEQDDRQDLQIQLTQIESRLLSVEALLLEVRNELKR